MTPGLRAILLGGPRPSLDFIFDGRPIDPRITTSGGANGTLINSAGLIVAATCPRITYDPVTLAVKGLLVEEARTNLLLNSTIDGANLATQSVTVTAVAHTLSFYGTGTVTLSGVSTAGPLVGSGAYPTRSTLTFTPTAGSLTLTVSGTVQFAQLEVSPNSCASSYIPTAGAAVTRTADSLLVSGSNFSQWFNPQEGTFLVEWDAAVADANAPTVLFVSAGAGSANAFFLQAYNNTYTFLAQCDSVISADIASGAIFSANTVVKQAASYAVNDFAQVIAGVAAGAPDVSGPVPIGPTQMRIGSGGAVQHINGHVPRLRYWNRKKPLSKLQALTAA